MNPKVLEATQGQTDSFFSQLPYKCYLFICGRLTYDLPLGYLQGGVRGDWDLGVQLATCVVACNSSTCVDACNACNLWEG